jgi:glycosyltransferase involved in cell wall biosynthesis
MRVLWTHNFDPARLNAGCFMYTAARGMAALGVDVRLEYLGNLRNPRTLAASQRHVRRIAGDFDLVHAQYGSACAIATSRCGAPSIVSLRGSDWNTVPGSSPSQWLHTKLAHLLTRTTLTRFHAAVCVSQRMARDVAAVAPRLHIEVIPSAIDLSRWPVRTSLRPGPRPPHRVLFVANNPLDPNKGARLLYAAAKLAAERVGEIQVVSATGVAHDDMPALVASCDAVACASKSEGWPNSVKEALACGLPFVSTDVSDLRLIANIEPSCQIAESNPESFANALCSVLSHGGLPPLRRHVEAMDLIASSRRLLALYQRLAAA